MSWFMARPSRPTRWLERRGARVVLVTTAGFEDLLWLRRQDRAALYDLARHHPEPLVARRT